MKVLVLLGGDSPEREVSLRSGRAVVDALKSAGHQVSEYDPVNDYEGISNFAGKVACVFPVLHGIGGEDGEVQHWLEKYNFKYLSSTPEVCELCIDKVRLKELLNESSILTPDGEVVNKDSFAKSTLATQPYVLKPIEGGSTIDCFIIREPQRQNIDPKIFDKYPEMLLEELIEGVEITVGVLGDSALPILEIIPPAGEEFDYENKYNGESQELYPPPHVSKAKQWGAQKLAEKAHALVGARHLSRTDMIIDKSGKTFVLELNTMPGLTPQSLYPKEAAAAGISMEELVQKFIDLTLYGV
jgi:D-alanine-D-alanine ligase